MLMAIRYTVESRIDNIDILSYKSLVTWKFQFIRILDWTMILDLTLNMAIYREIEIPLYQPVWFGMSSSIQFHYL